MKLFLLPALCLVSIATAQVHLELNDFDIPKALSDLGINVKDLPKISDDSFSRKVACSAACTSLAAIHGSSSIIQSGTTEYEDFVTSYWSQLQATVEPYCIFTPKKASDLSTLVLISRLTRCPFSVKSGGHSAFPGASNSIGGITVALRNLKSIELSADRKTVAVEPGNTWTNVYTELEQYGLAPIGGRVSNIGVGGLTLGGGISFLSSLYGWACDNVESYEVVLANGSIVTASESIHPDLFWALRGGGNNFGIVTKFTLDTYESETMHTGYRIYTEQHFDAVLDAYHHQVAHSHEDGNALGWLAFIYSNKTPLAVPELSYTKNESSPPIYEKYIDIASVYDARKPQNLAAYTISNWEQQPVGLRDIYQLITTETSPELAKYGVDLYFEMIKGIADVKALIPAYILHPITTPQLRNMRKRGGNALGLDPDGPALHMHQLSVSWADGTDDETIYRFCEAFHGKLAARAKEMGIMKDFVYMNYASMFQDPIASYGADNKKRLVEIAGRYDPNGLFQKLQPGHFKLSGAPYKSVDEWVAAKDGGDSKEEEEKEEKEGRGKATDGGEPKLNEESSSDGNEVKEGHDEL